MIIRATHQTAFALLAGLLLTGATTAPQVYSLDPMDSSASAKVSFLGLGSKTAGFPNVSGTVRFDESMPDDVTLDLSIDARALTAGDGVTLRRLKSEKFFWVEKYPTVRFTGKQLEMTSPTKGTVTGQLTARGVSRQQTFAVSFDKPPLTSVGEAINVVASTTINRRDYGMKSYSLIVGRNVNITLKARLAPT
ncbi:MAG: YceI family protein [Erythrobacter sp.]